MPKVSMTLPEIFDYAEKTGRTVVHMSWGQANLSTVHSYLNERCIGYNAGTYGWNYDVYEVGKYLILSGYRVPSTTHNHHIPSFSAEQLKEYTGNFTNY